MRLWSLHPSYLDTKGLVACWREGLLARKVLEGKTKGYRYHPQVLRFKNHAEPIAAIDQYLFAVLEEAIQRGFLFDSTKIKRHHTTISIPVTDGQLIYELNHLKDKLISRDTSRYMKLCQVNIPIPNPIFHVVRGGIESWEKVTGEKRTESELTKGGKVSDKSD